ncbi:hypothetical protein, variant [Spizellomyces punctatus DAOM BR117]|nr:hypothetical protein, variant [Spizellomyces punctatus DAOM BR117]KND03541.1 hypothetical protein, variant [Spizellomyces punctatus DAOM BR117]|eukprot:XP_016611580.1 hypothetical protein, variant [Spizellomyces punctatus DAOM BR117]
MDKAETWKNTHLRSQIGYHDHEVNSLELDPYNYAEEIRREDSVLDNWTPRQVTKEEPHIWQDLAQSLASVADPRDFGSRAHRDSLRSIKPESGSNSIYSYLHQKFSPYKLSRKTVDFYTPSKVNSTQIPIDVDAPHTARDARLLLLTVAQHVLTDVDHETLESFVDEVIDICKTNHKSDHDKVNEIKTLIPGGWKEDADHDTLVDMITLAEGVARLSDVVEDGPDAGHILDGKERERVIDNIGEEDPPRVFGRQAYVVPKTNRVKQALMGDNADTDFSYSDDDLAAVEHDVEYIQVEAADD